MQYSSKNREYSSSTRQEKRKETISGNLKQLDADIISVTAEIEELGVKYKEFYHVMGNVVKSESEKSRLEDAVMGVAVEAEMQGFIYGFKVFEVLASRAIATV